MKKSAHYLSTAFFAFVAVNIAAHWLNQMDARTVAAATNLAYRRTVTVVKEADEESETSHVEWISIRP